MLCVRQIACARKSACTGPPLEEHLAQSSLWPEVAKLYGHGAELFCVAASPSGDLLASACKAQTSSTAAVWLWDTSTWAALGSLTAHSLTVTQLQFSPDGQWLLSVSRDRTVAVYQRGTGGLLGRSHDSCMPALWLLMLSILAASVFGKDKEQLMHVRGCSCMLSSQRSPMLTLQVGCTFVS